MLHATWCRASLVWTRPAVDPGRFRQMIVERQISVYRFKPQMASAEHFREDRSGSGYIWGFWCWFYRIRVPERAGISATSVT